MPNFRVVFYNILFVAALGGLAYAVLRPQPASWPVILTLLMIAGLLGFFANADRVEFFKAGAGGVEARTREVVREAQVAINEIHALAEAMAYTLFDLIDGGGRWGGRRPADKDAQKERLRETLARLGLSADRIEAAAAPERKWARVDYVLAIYQRHQNDNSEVFTRFKADFEGHWEDAPPLRVSEMAASDGDPPPWRAALVRDYEHHFRTGRHRRPEVWAVRNEWDGWIRHDSWPAWATR